MKAKFEIIENTVTDYLNKLDELANDEGNTRRFLKDSAQEMHFEYIEPLMPKWNPNLMYSPLEPEHQIVKISKGVSSIELLYTGFTEEAREGDLPKGVWSEFGDKFTGTLERDYALYQETGQDPIAPDFAGHHFVKRGTHNYLNQFYTKTDAYLDRLMHLEQWQKNWYVSLYDYME